MASRVIRPIKRAAERRDAVWVIALLSLLAIVVMGVVVTFWTAGGSAGHADHATHDHATHVHAGHAGETVHHAATPSHNDFFTNGGYYMPRTHCLMTAQGKPDWPWIIALIVLNLGIIVAYLRIYYFWTRSYFAEEARDRNPRLMDLAQIFLWCAVCGYVASVIVYFWPAYRFVAVCLLMLNLWSWRFVLNLKGFKSAFTAGRYQRLAEYDKLTGLRNRMCIRNTLDAALAGAQRAENGGVALLFMDFDRFKLVNDSMGHEAGDALLIQVAQRLEDLCEQSNEPATDNQPALTCTPGRLGGDEFVIIIEGFGTRGKIIAICDRIEERLSEAYTVDGRVICSSASIGVTTSERPGQTSDGMLRDADIAMYEAKRLCRGTTAFFDEKMHEAVREAVEIEHDLRRGIPKNELVLHYQPCIDLETGEVSGFEALVRWQHPERGLLYPDKFIAIAEQSPLIMDLGRWVLMTAAAQIAQWRQQYPHLAKAKMCVNVSPRQLIDDSFPGEALNLVLAQGAATDMICLEITESVIMANRAHAICLLEDLRGLGFSLAMDDFGTGYSSLNCLHEFPLDVLKIDRSFIQQLTHRRDFSSVVHAIAEMAGNLGYKIIAEGIETPEQVVQLQALGCDFGQGYFFHKPAPAETIARFLDFVGEESHAAFAPADALA